jgi:phospholipid/cholesterol/gamma-HCH transport system substrate-binding protein
LLPKTLFGERYVALLAGSDAEPTLADGGEIRQDASAETAELEEVFDELLPMLRTIQPEKLSATLGEMAAMLRGQGAGIGDSMAAWAAYLKKLNPKVPQMTADLAALGRVAVNYADAVPDLLDALDTMAPTSRTLVAERDQLRKVYATVIDASNTSTGWVRRNDKTIRVLSKSSRKALAAVAPYASEFPCLFSALTRFIPEMDRNLGEGTGQPGIHVVLNIVDKRNKYIPGVDAPAYATGGKPRCPYVTGQPDPVQRLSATGKANSTGKHARTRPDTIPAPPSSRLAAADGDLGPANSPAENQFIAELLAPTQRLSPSEYPAWASLLLGPVLRDAEVKLK